MNSIHAHQNVMSLADLPSETTGRVTNIEGGFRFTKKLNSMGLRVGLQITKASSVFGRGPVVCSIGETQIAMGHRMALRIMVEYEPGS